MAKEKTPPEHLVQRGAWGSKLAFVLAAAGSAIGLGNVWKFPYITGVYGGGAFVFVYLISVLLVGLPLLMAEILLGKSSHRDPVGTFKVLAPDKPYWQLVGWLGVTAGFVILSFYSVVAGWALSYVFRSIFAPFSGLSPHQVESLFGKLASSPGVEIAWHFIFMAITVGIVIGGVKKGIERWSKILMPLLFAIIIFLDIYAATTSGFGKGISFLFKPDFTKLTPDAILQALGHSFFTLSLGMGAMITYGSYMRDEDDIVVPAISVAFLDTLIALMAGIAIFPIVFAFGLAPSAGPGLVFKTLPVVFSRIHFGMIISFLFFTLLTFAALTSAISLLEVVVAFFVDELGWNRKIVTPVMGFLIFLLGVPSAIWDNFFGFVDWLSTNIFLPVGGFFIALFAAFVLKSAIKKIHFAKYPDWVYKSWNFTVGWISPFLVAIMILNRFGILKLIFSSPFLRKLLGVE